ncbi:MAG TPA: hypothetical protein VHZ55_11400 [Bryobacteraceae bacterium]|nr:hypothetical protein [Bryobacteraceae bacterium]
MAIVLLGDQLAMPGQQSIGRDQHGHFSQQLAAQPLTSYSWAPALVVIEKYSPISELLAQYSILLSQVLDHLLLVLIHPAGSRHQQELKRIKHSRHLLPILATPLSIHEPAVNSFVFIFGPYAAHACFL